MEKYEIRIKSFAFTNDYEVLDVEFNKKEADKLAKMYKDCPKFKGCNIYVERVR